MNRIICVVEMFVLLSGCSTDIGDVDNNLNIGSVQQTLMWQGESIERDDNGTPQTAYYMYTVDPFPPSSICGSDGGDYIVHYNRSGAYANRSKLRMDAVPGTGAGCMLTLFGNHLSARVYDDSHVWVCAGKTRTDLCGGPDAVFGGLQLWQVP